MYVYVCVRGGGSSGIIYLVSLLLRADYMGHSLITRVIAHAGIRTSDRWMYPSSNLPTGPSTYHLGVARVSAVDSPRIFLKKKKSC